MATNLKVISLKHCTVFHREVLNIFNSHCNPFILSELYLDGCEGVNDQCFDCLMLSKEEILLEQLSQKQLIKEESKDSKVEISDNLSMVTN